MKILSADLMLHSQEYRKNIYIDLTKYLTKIHNIYIYISLLRFIR